MTSHRILHVDDEADIREIAVMCLELEPSFEVRGASSGAQALEIAGEWVPDLVLLDVMMPGMDGPETLQRLRADERTADVRVVFMTARTQSSDVQRFLGLGALGVIAKPFDPMMLAGEARGYLQR